MRQNQQQPKKKMPVGRPFVKGDERINRNGAPPKQSFRVHFDTAFDNKTRKHIAHEYARQAAKGSIPHLEVALRLLGEGQHQPTAGQINILQLITGSDRQTAQRLFTAIAMGVRDAGGLGVVRESGQLDTLAAPDVDQ